MEIYNILLHYFRYLFKSIMYYKDYNFIRDIEIRKKKIERTRIIKFIKSITDSCDLYICI